VLGGHHRADAQGTAGHALECGDLVARLFPQAEDALGVAHQQFTRGRHLDVAALAPGQRHTGRLFQQFQVQGHGRLRDVHGFRGPRDALVARDQHEGLQLLEAGWVHKLYLIDFQEIFIFILSCAAV
jgi:hypothetical protein